MNKAITLLFFVCLLFGCTIGEKKRTKIIGVSQCMLDDAWRQAMIREIQIELSNYDNIELVVRNADSNNERQIKQIRELIGMKVDVLVISPYESQPITSVAKEAYEAGIPTIITDRKVNTDKYTSFIGGDSYKIGYEAGLYVSQNFTKKKLSLIEVWGLPSSSPAQERHSGFMDALATNNKVLNIQTIEGNWRYDTTKLHITQLTDIEHLDLAYCHNDMMAIAVREYFDQKDSLQTDKIPIIGVDAVAGAGLEAIADGRIDISFTYPTGGEEIVRTAIKIMNGEAVQKDIVLETTEINMDEARTLLMQSQQMSNYQQSIVQKKERIDALLQRFSFLENSLSIILLLCFALGIMLFIIFRTNKKIKERNAELSERNRREEEQSKKLIALNTEIEKTTAQKLQLFTNISHEIRTPLTLIISPLEKLMGMLKESPYQYDLQLMYKNSQRLLREVNQMLDFRKIDNQKQVLNKRLIKIAPFVEDIKCYFDGEARQRHINYHIITQNIANDLTLSIDTDLMEKVLVNILSNAFKYTPDSGSITIEIKEDADNVGIIITDNGKGIEAKELPNIFERFYTTSNATGTGIGLYLAKEFVTLHNGTLKAESEEGKYTKMTIDLPKSTTNIEKKQVEDDQDPYKITTAKEVSIQNMLKKKYAYTILIVEDNEDIRLYLQKELSLNFDTLAVSNSQKALEILNEKEISLVLSDVMMPQMNGFELCATLKNDINYSHIPIILLTALSNERQRIYGTATGADDYISKPFSIDFVKVKIIHLIETQQNLHQQLLKKVEKDNTFKNKEIPIENLDDLFLRKLLTQIDKVYIDSEYNVERLSEALGMSRGHLYRKVKELTGLSPVDYLRKYRLKKATELIRQHKLNISEIAYQTGFSSPAYFTKCFKIEYNVTPTEFV